MVLPASTVSVNYNADGSGYIQTMGEMVTATSQYTDISKGAVGAVAKLGYQFTKIAADTSSFGNATNTAVRQAAAYQQALSGIAIKAEAAGKSVNNITSDIRKTARTSPMSLTQSIQQYQTLFELGVTSEKKLKPLSDSLTSIGAATDQLGNVQFSKNILSMTRAFDSMDSNNIDHVSDSIVGLTANVGGSADSIAHFSKSIAPLSEQMGMTQTDVLGFSAAFSAAGEDNYRAANVYTKMISDMERSVRTGAPGLELYSEALGKSTKEMKELFKSNPGEVVAQLFDSLGAGGDDAIRRLDQLGLDGVRSIKTLTAISASGGVRKAMDEASESFGSGLGAKAAEESLGGLNNELNKVQDSMAQIVEASGRPYVGMMSGVASLAAKAAGGTAAVVGSDLAQGIGTVAMIGSGMYNTASKVAGGAFTYGAIKNSIQSTLGPDRMGKVGGFISAHKGKMVGAGMAGIAAGTMVDNPMLGMLGTGALLLGSTAGSGMLGKARDAGGAVMRGLVGDPMSSFGPTVRAQMKSGGIKGKATDFFAGSRNFYGAASGGVKDIGEQLVNLTGASGRKLSTDFITARGGHDAERMKKVLEKVEDVYKKEFRVTNDGVAAKKKANELLGNLSKQAKEEINVNKFRAKTMQTGRQMAAAVPRAAWGGISALAPALTNPITGPLVVGGALIAGGAYGYYKNKQREEEAGKISNSQTKLLSEKYRISMNEFGGAGEELDSNVRYASTWGDALNVNESVVDKAKAAGEEAKMELTDDDKERIGKGDYFSIVNKLTRIGGSQKPAFVAKLLADVGLQTTGAHAANIGKLLKPNINSVEGLTKAMGNLNQDYGTGPISKGWYGNTLGVFSNDYTGKKELEEEGTSAGLQAKTRISRVEDVYGKGGGAREKKKYLDAWFDEMAKGQDVDKDAQRKYLTQILDGDTEAVERVLAVGMEYNHDSTRDGTGIVVDHDESDTGYPRAVYTTDSGKREDWAYGGNLNNEAKTPIDKTKVKEMEDASDVFSKSMAVVSGAALKAGITTSEAAEIWREGAEATAANHEEFKEGYDKWKEEQGKKGIDPWLSTEKKYLESLGVTETDVTRVEAVDNPEDAAKTAAAATESLFDGRSAKQTVLDAQETLFSDRGKDPGVAQAMKTEIAQGAGAKRELEKLSEAPITQIIGDVELAHAQYQGAKKANKGPNAGVETAAELRRTEAGVVKSLQQVDAFYEGFLLKQREFEKSSARAWEDFGINAARAREDLEIQSGYAREDHALQQQYAREDFSQNRGWAQEDFDLGMERSVEDSAAGLMDPYTREVSKPRWSGDGLADNIDDENQLLKRQLAGIEKLEKRGLSKEAIQFLGLMNPGMSQQVFELLNSSPETLAQLNRKVGKRMDIAGEFASSSHNVANSRAEEDFDKSMDRQSTTFEKSLSRSDDQLEKSLNRSRKTLNRSLNHRRKDLGKQLARSQEDLNEYGMGIAADTEEMYKQISRHSEGYGIEWNKILSGSLMNVSNEFTTSGNQWIKKTQKALKRVNKLLREFAVDGKVGDPDYLDPTSSSSGTSSGPNPGAGENRNPGAGQGGNGAIPPAAPAPGGGQGGNNLIPPSGSPSASAPGGGQGGNGSIRPSSMGTSLGGLYDGLSGVSTSANDVTDFSGDYEISATASAGGASGADSMGGASGTASAGSVSGDASVGVLNNSDATYVSKAGNSSDQWKSLYNAKQGALLEAITEYGPLKGGFMTQFKGELGDFKKDSAFGEHKMTPSGILLGRSAAHLWPNLTTIGGWRPSDPFPDHPSGRAVDIMIPNYSSPHGKKQGSEIARFYQANKKMFDVKYIIWNNKIWSGGDWRGYGGGPDDTSAHRDHVHITVYGANEPQLGTGLDTSKFDNRKPKDMTIWQIGDTIWERGVAVDDFEKDVYGSTAMAKGGVVTSPINALIGEAGYDEAVIPLNSGGVDTIVEVMEKYYSRTEARMSRTAPYTQPVQSTTTYIDSSVRFEGDISVKAQTPEELTERILMKQRSDSLYDVSSARGLT